MEQFPAGMDPGPGWQWPFWSIFAGQSLSLIGSAMTQFVLIWWIPISTQKHGRSAYRPAWSILCAIPFGDAASGFGSNRSSAIRTRLRAT